MSRFNKNGILGINARNLLFIRPYNKGKALSMADSKLSTKSFLSARGIPVPKLYGVIRSREDLNKFDFSSLPNSFVLKPNQGAGGEGILPIWDRKEGGYVLSEGRFMDQETLEEHIADTLDGRFSISGVADMAFFEQRLISDERLGKFAFKGLPDIRVVVYNLVPVMAMLRIPTRRSHGKANLHQGAIGVGIDIAKGETTHVVELGKIVDDHPDYAPLRGVKIPYWNDILHISSKVQLATNLGYLAADIALDQANGPVLLEINARAGLAVQIANLAPLRRRLERIQGVKVPTPEKGVRVAKDMFGNVVEKEIKSVSGKEVVGSLEKVKLLVGTMPYMTKAYLDTNQEKTKVDCSFAQKHGFLPENYKAGDSMKIKFILAGVRVQTVVTFEDLSGQDHDVLIGRRDLHSFLIDPSRSVKEDGKGLEALPTIKKPKEDDEILHVKRHFRELDEVICELDGKIKLLFHLRPVNLEEESQSFLEGKVENPQFVYPALKFDAFELKDHLHELSPGDSLLGRLFHRKRLEILQKIDLLEHRGTEFFAMKSIDLFGDVTPLLLDSAKTYFSKKPTHFSSEGPLLSFDTIVHRFQQFFDEQGLKHWSIRSKKEMVADCVAGKRNVLFLKEGLQFTESRFKMVLAHEIQTHVYTAENGSYQPYKIFRRGTGGYLTTQEGLAIYQQERVVDHLTPKHFWNAALVLLIATAQTGSFREVYEHALDLGYESEKAFQVALKTKRGLEDTSLPGAFTKDLLYFKGKQMVESFVQDGGELSRLYIGKIDLPSLEEIEQLEFLVPPKHLPTF